MNGDQKEECGARMVAQWVAAFDTSMTTWVQISRIQVTLAVCVYSSNATNAGWETKTRECR